MKQKDFSGITKLLKTNGVGFIECFFRSNLYPEDMTSNDTIPWRLDFSDGVNYLGSLMTSNDECDNVLTKGDGPIIKECKLYLGKFKGLKQEICITLYFSATFIQGKCLIAHETAKLE